jgi:hypothetical protein
VDGRVRAYTELNRRDAVQRNKRGENFVWAMGLNQSWRLVNSNERAGGLAVGAEGRGLGSLAPVFLEAIGLLTQGEPCSTTLFH